MELDAAHCKADFGINLGVGMAAIQRFGFYARYMAGLNDVSKNNIVTNRNRGGQLGMYVRLH
ncbi:hypothetical protein [Paraflavitalea speifideaquila]|uniref:hypothetical protein n=1 Tax=Paraflavitalea speifideaquila TaxID=3076558 RepID=UPI0028E703FA|nr:hypothetical protein [Paraflavitalea speifideiaquila]